MGVGTGLREVHDVTSEGADTLTSHGVTLVGHSRRANLAMKAGVTAYLILLEGFLHLLQVGQETDVARELVAGGSDTGEDREDVVVNLTGVCLTRHRNLTRESHQLTHALVELLDLLVVSFKQVQEGGLGTGSALDTTEGEVLVLVLQVLQIEEEVLGPQASTLTNSRAMKEAEERDRKKKDM